MNVAVAGLTMPRESLYAAIGVFLDTHGLGPEPAHYAFAHAALTDPEMASAVDRLTDGGVRLGRRSIEALGGTVAATAAARQAEEPLCPEDHRVAALVAQAQAQVEALTGLMRTLREETSGFGRDLAASAAELKGQPAIEGLDEIARITGAMVTRVHDAEARLARATAEAEQLRCALADAEAAARRDPLTGLPNRLAFEEAFAAADTDPVCLAVADVDHFKRLNDMHGHGVGDRVLCAIADGLVESCGGQLVARHGGEEFTVLTRGLSLPRATALLDEARIALGARRLHDRDTKAALGRITLSAGVVAIQRGETIAAALGRADRLLYAAKAGGRDAVRSG